MDNIRHLAEADLPDVALLFQRIFRHSTGPVPPSLAPYLKEIYFNNPWYDESISSLVYESDGKIAGFVGALQFPFRLNGSRIMTILAGNLMVNPDLRNPMAAVRLLKRLFEGPQDATLTDTATDAARKLWESLGSATIPSLGLQWVRPLSPLRFAALLARRASPVFAPVEFLSRPLCAATDALLQKWQTNPLHLEASSLREEELSVETHLEGMKSFYPERSLVPDYSTSTLEWVTAHAAAKKEYGELRKVALFGRSNSLVGWYLFYPNPGFIGQVLQCVATPREVSGVLRHLLLDARAHGSRALMGRFDPYMVREMSILGCLFTHRGSSVQAHTRRKEIIQSLHSGDAFFTRLEGEWWTRLQGDIFE